MAFRSKERLGKGQTGAGTAEGWARREASSSRGGGRRGMERKRGLRRGEPAQPALTIPAHCRRRLLPACACAFLWLLYLDVFRFLRLPRKSSATSGSQTLRMYSAVCSLCVTSQTLNQFGSGPSRLQLQPGYSHGSALDLGKLGYEANVLVARIQNCAGYVPSTTPECSCCMTPFRVIEQYTSIWM